MSAAVPWSRPELFGAWVRLDDATLIAVDRDLAARLGVEHGRRLPSPGPLELHLSVTARCFAGCAGCYMDARPEGDEPSFEDLCARLDEARAAGVSTVAFGGGEPLLRRDLGALAARARALGLVPVVTTSGLGLTDARAAELRAFSQVNVSHDGAGEGYAAVRGYAGSGAAERAIATLAAAGVPVGANVVLTRATFDLLPATADRVARVGAREIQLLRYKPAGRAADGYEDRRLLPEQVDRLWPSISALSKVGRLRVRIDCAMVPLLSTALLRERGARMLAELGVFGCEAARHLGARRADGAAAPCSFFTAEAGAKARASAEAVARASAEAAAARAAAEAPALLVSARWLPVLQSDGADALRAYHAAPPEPCRSCELLDVCRGGCQVVSRYATGRFAPDPECPRVRAHNDAHAALR